MSNSEPPAYHHPQRGDYNPRHVEIPRLVNEAGDHFYQINVRRTSTVVDRQRSKPLNQKNSCQPLMAIFPRMYAPRWPNPFTTKNPRATRNSWHQHRYVKHRDPLHRNPWRTYTRSRVGTRTNAHCVLLKHYYSVDFPWWFDRKLSILKSNVKNSWNQSVKKFT